MERSLVIALGFAAAASLLRVVAGCGSSSNASGSSDGGGDATSISDTGSLAVAGDGGGDQGDDTSAECFAGCLCFAPDACGTGCYLEQAFAIDGSAMPLYCGNGIAQCGQQGAAWSFGQPMNVCLSGAPVYVDGGPDGAMCCANGLEKETDAGDAGADAAADAGID